MGVHPFAKRSRVVVFLAAFLAGDVLVFRGFGGVTAGTGYLFHGLASLTPVFGPELLTGEDNFHEWTH